MYPQNTKPSNHPALELIDQVRKHLLLQGAMGIEGYSLRDGLKNLLSSPDGDNETCCPDVSPRHQLRMKSSPKELSCDRMVRNIEPHTAEARKNEENFNAGSASAVVFQQPARISLNDVRQELGDCRRCELCNARKTIVFGSGDPHARLIIVGEWPTAEDDLAGQPFSEEAGELLEKMLAAIGINRQEVYTTYAVKCLAPGDKEAGKAMKACLPFLFRQIQTISPGVICAMGSFAVQALLKTKKNLLQLRGRFHDFQGIPVMPTFTPDFLNRNQEMKKAAWHDLQILAKQYIQMQKK